MTRKLLMTVAIVAIALVPSICIGIAQARAFGGGFGGDGSTAAGMAVVFTAAMVALSGLLWIWQFPILLLLLLIGYSWRPGTAQVRSEAKARPTGGA
jgi:hypothetical protein